MKLVIYTVITGSYDTLRQPKWVDDRFNYICFSNDFVDKRVGVWGIRNFKSTNSDNQRLSRYPKLKPHELLKEFDYSVYMDANLVIARSEFYDDIFRLINENETFAGIKNGWRDCLYDEGFRCILSGLDTLPKIMKEMRFIKSEKFPSHYGMYEANIIFRNHHNETVIKQSNLWWDMVSNHAKRDQLSLSYTLWKCGIPWCYIFTDGTNTHNNPNIVFHQHPHRLNSLKKIGIRQLFKFTKPILDAIYKLSISVRFKDR
jgi:hypothetical protein